MASVIELAQHGTPRAKGFYVLPHDLRRLLFAVTNEQKFRNLQQRRTISGSTYSYRPFDQHQCIFVHVPKTGGISICRSLFGDLAGGHDPISIYQVVYSKREFNRYFKFAFVRNPWDRLHSAYRFLRGGGLTRSDAAWAKVHLSRFDSFNDFVHAWINPNNVNVWIHFVPQYRFLCSPRSARLLVDYIGLFENIEDDFAYIRNRLSLGRPLDQYNLTGGEKIDYRDIYSDESRRIVARVYQRDIELFGYCFDGSSLASQLRARDRIRRISAFS